MNTDRGNHSPVDINQIIGGINSDMPGGVDTDRPEAVRLNHFRQGAPAPHVTPPHLHRHHLHPGGFLHDSVINRNVFDIHIQGRYSLLQTCIFPGCAGREQSGKLTVQGRHERSHFFKNRIGPPDKHATVPEIIALIQIPYGFCQRRLFHKASDRKRPLSAAE